MMKNHWFYKQRGLKTKKNIGFTVKPSFKRLLSQMNTKKKVKKPFVFPEKKFR